MAIEFTNKDKIKMVKKPWGHERWIADGSSGFRYAFKEIFYRAPHRTSIQFHKFKEETSYIQRGKGILHYSDVPIDIQKFENDGYSQSDIQQIIKGLKQHELTPGTIVNIKPRIIHRVEAVEDLTSIEVSTIELDDVIRLQDDMGRPSGHIESEHLN